MPRRRFTKKQQEAVLAIRAKRRRACARGRHYWYPDYSFFKKEEGPRVPGQYWTIEQRFPVPIWDRKSIICTSCNLRGNIGKLPSKKRKYIRDIIKLLKDNALSMQKDYIREQALEGKPDGC